MMHEAIRNIHPNAVTIVGDSQAFDVENNPVDINWDLVKVEAARLQQQFESTEYQFKRKFEYPPLTELADALYHQQNGDDSKMTAYLAKVEAVKQKYPKE